MTEVKEAERKTYTRGLLFGLFLLGFLVNLPFFSHYTVGLNDEAVVAVGAERLLAGEFPYRDWDSRFPPGSYLVTALSFFVFGTNLVGLRVVMLLTNALLGLFVFLISARLMPRNWALLATGLVLIGVGSQVPIVSYHLMAIVALLAGVWTLGSWVEEGTPRYLAGFGVAFSAACFSLQTEAAALLLCGVAVALVFRSRLNKVALRHFGLGFLLSSAFLWSWVLVVSSPAEVWRDNVVNAVGLTRIFNESPYTPSHLVGRWQDVLLQASRASVTGGTVYWFLNSLAYLMVWTLEYALFFPLAGLILAVALRKREEAPSSVGVCLGALAAFTFISRHRLDMLYLKYLTPLWYVLLIWLIYRYAPKREWLGGGLAALYLAFYGFSAAETMDYKYPIVTPRGTLYSNSPQQAELAKAEYGLIAQATPPGTVSLFYPYACAKYFWAGVRNSIRPPVLVPLLYSQEQFDSAKTELEKGKPEIIYHTPLGEGVFHDYPRMDRELFGTEYKKQLEFLFENYTAIGGGPTLQVYRRKPETESP